jgi:hypothetical protein
MRLFTLRTVKQGARSDNRTSGVAPCCFLLLVAATAVSGGCGVKTVYLHDGKQKLSDVSVVVWAAPDPPADSPSIALSKIDGTKLGGAAPMNRAELLPGAHDFLISASYPSATGDGARKPPKQAATGDGPAKFSVKNVSLQPGACYVVASDLLGDAWMEPVVRDARPTDPGFKLCEKR